MRLELVFEIKKPELPKDNKSIWVSFLKRSLTNCGGGRFFERYFKQGGLKDYSFSVILPKPKFQKDLISLGGSEIKMIFSADDKRKTGLIFYSALLAQKDNAFRLPNGNEMVLKVIRQKSEQLITSSKIVVKTVVGGGLVIREHNKAENKDKYYTVADDLFEQKAAEILGVQAFAAGFRNERENQILLKPLQCKKVVVKHYGVYIDVTTGTFKLEAKPDLLQYVYQAGLGSKHSMGYGLLDLVVQE